MQEAFSNSFPKSSISLDTDDVTKGLEADMDDRDYAFYSNPQNEIEQRLSELDMAVLNNPNYALRYQRFLEQQKTA